MQWLKKGGGAKAAVALIEGKIESWQSQRNPGKLIPAGGQMLAFLFIGGMFVIKLPGQDQGIEFIHTGQRTLMKFQGLIQIITDQTVGQSPVGIGVLNGAFFTQGGQLGIENRTLTLPKQLPDIDKIIGQIMIDIKLTVIIQKIDVGIDLMAN